VQVARRPAAPQIADQGYRIDEAALLHRERALLVAQLRLLRRRHGGVVDRPRFEFRHGDVGAANGVLHRGVERLGLCVQDA
jgi:hypothetical protein